MRQPTHDYTVAGAYFVTICAHERHLLFEEDAIRQTITWAWNAIPKHFQADIDSFVVMPNHIHGIIVLHDENRRMMVGLQHAAGLPSMRPRPTLSVIVRSFKAAVTRELRLQRLWDDQPFWQNGFYDRVIRDGKELSRIRQYIARNPEVWLHDHENPAAIPEERHSLRWSWLENVHE